MDIAEYMKTTPLLQQFVLLFDPCLKTMFLQRGDELRALDKRVVVAEATDIDCTSSNGRHGWRRAVKGNNLGCYRIHNVSRKYVKKAIGEK